jgi:hypothetical protein
LVARLDRPRTPARCSRLRYPWADPDYDLVHASIVPCNADILQDLNGARKAETTSEDNLKTVRLVFASYEIGSEWIRSR